MNNPKGIAYAALSSSTFGLAPLFTVTLLRDGFSPFEVLTYRWGVASAALLLFGLATGRRLRIARRDFGVVFLLSLFRAGCSSSPMPTSPQASLRPFISSIRWPSRWP